MRINEFRQPARKPKKRRFLVLTKKLMKRACRIKKAKKTIRFKADRGISNKKTKKTSRRKKNRIKIKIKCFLKKDNEKSFNFSY